MGILISDKGEFRAKKITRDRRRHFIMMKWSITKKHLTIPNVYASATKLNLCEENFIKLKGQINEATIIVGNIHFPPWIVGGTTRKKINKAIRELSNNINNQ